MQKTLLCALLCALAALQVYGRDNRRTLMMTSFQLKYDRGIAASDVKALGEMLDSAAAEYQGIFGVRLKGQPLVYVFGSVNRFQEESKSVIFDDGVYRAGSIFIVLPARSRRTEGMQPVVERVVANAVLDRIPGCPRWLAQAYSLYAGGDLDRFGNPAELNISAFSDLGEDFVRTEEPKQLPDLYATLAVTIQFLVERYGRAHVEEALIKFKTGEGVDQVFPAIFQEPYKKIEAEWVKAIRSRMNR